MSRVLVFGTFDSLHEGHRAMLTEAMEHGAVVVSLALDEVVERLKGRLPSQSFNERQKVLLQSHLVKEVITGDSVEGEYGCLREARPDLVAFGYDQEALRQDWLRWQQVTGDATPHIVLQPYQPELYKSSLLRRGL